MVDARGGYTPTPAVSRAILAHNASGTGPRADGIVVTPSHNPPPDGGFKYNPPDGGPAGTDITRQIQDRANELLADGLKGVRRVPYARAAAAGTTGKFDFLGSYVAALGQVVDLAAIKAAGVRIGADPLGGASVAYWGEIGDRYGLDLTVVNPVVDATFRFMTLDWDGKIRMDCSSPSAMASLIGRQHEFAVATGNDTDADRHGIVTPDAGLLNPNHYLAVAIDYLYRHRDGWPSAAAVGKTLVSSSMIDRVTEGLGRELLEVPVGFKWFVPGLLDGSVAFGGEESAGASFLQRDGSVWTTDKDGIILALLASEITAVTGHSPSELYRDLTSRYGDPAYARIDTAASREQKAALAELSPAQVAADRTRGRADHRGADDRAGQRRADRRAQGGRRVRLVRRPPVRHRGRLQAVRRILPRARSTSPPSRTRPARSSPPRSAAPDRPDLRRLVAQPRGSLSTRTTYGLHPGATTAGWASARGSCRAGWAHGAARRGGAGMRTCTGYSPGRPPWADGHPARRACRGTSDEDGPPRGVPCAPVPARDRGRAGQHPSGPRGGGREGARRFAVPRHRPALNHGRLAPRGGVRQSPPRGLPATGYQRLSSERGPLRRTAARASRAARRAGRGFTAGARRGRRRIGKTRFVTEGLRDTVSVWGAACRRAERKGRCAA